MPKRRCSTILRAAVVTTVALSLGSVTGCYVYEPVTASMVAPGTAVAIDLNEMGRLNLASLIGPEVRRVSGMLVSESSNEYVVRVNQLTFLNQRESQWGGEALTVRSDYVSALYAERLSASRTALAFAGGAGAVGALLAAKSLLGNGGGSNDPKPPQPPNPASRGN